MSGARLSVSGGEESISCFCAMNVVNYLIVCCVCRMLPSVREMLLASSSSTSARSKLEVMLLLHGGYKL